MIAYVLFGGMQATTWVQIVKAAPFPLRNPGLVSIPLAFLVGIVVSLAAPEPETAERFETMQHRLHLGPEEGE